eukprot:c13970_g1_i1.p1 GENE.c13970_g1_i1~~c13970_g1_i1.p1  ORF type:complete len:405 (+),score=79.45 c13970_g1_i1:25-1239(+)
MSHSLLLADLRACGLPTCSNTIVATRIASALQALRNALNDLYRDGDFPGLKALQNSLLDGGLVDIVRDIVETVNSWNLPIQDDHVSSILLSHCFRVTGFASFNNAHFATAMGEQQTVLSVIYSIVETSAMVESDTIFPNAPSNKSVVGQALYVSCNVVKYAQLGHACRLIPLAVPAAVIVSNSPHHEERTVRQAVTFLENCAHHAQHRPFLRSVDQYGRVPYPAPATGFITAQLAAIACENSMNHNSVAAALAVAWLVGHIDNHPALLTISGRLLRMLHQSLCTSLKRSAFPGTKMHFVLAGVVEGLAVIAAQPSNQRELLGIKVQHTIVEALEQQHDLSTQELRWLVATLYHLRRDAVVVSWAKGQGLRKLAMVVRVSGDAASEGDPHLTALRDLVTKWQQEE